MDMFNLEYYRAFYCAAKNGSITKASEELFLTQPAVTHSIQRLEEQMGCRLFHRAPRGVHLTAEGEALFAYVDKAFQALAAGQREVRQMAALESGTLVIAATETPLYHILLPVVRRFRALYPRITLHVRGSSTADTIRLLRSHQADLALAVSPLETPEDMTVQPIDAFHDVFLAGPAFSQLRGRPLSYEEVFRYPIVAVESGTSARGHLEEWFARREVTFHPDFSVRTSSTILPFVQQGLAIGIVPRMFAEPLLDRADENGLFLLDTEPIPPRQVLLILRRDGQSSVLSRRFVELLQTAGE